MSDSTSRPEGREPAEERTISSERIYKGKVVSLRVDKVKLPDGRSSTREIIEHRGAVAIVPLTEEGEIVFVKQYRKPVEMVLLEIPAGTLEEGEEAEECAQRELIEEIGYRAGKMEKLTEFFLAPGYSSELIRLYLATDLKAEKGDADEDEFLKIEYLSSEEAVEKVENGEIKDAKTIAGILLTKKRIDGVRS